MQPKRQRVTASVELESLMDKSGHGSSYGPTPLDMSPPLQNASDMPMEALPSSSLSPAVTKISHNEEAELGVRTPKPKTPIPYLQVFFIAIWRMSQSLFFLVIMPFLNPMLVQDLAVSDEVHVGNYSGLVETFASAGMIPGVFIFARLSDLYGRKWITLGGVFVASILCAAFGFTRTFSGLLLLRFLMGFANSCQSATSKVMVSELTDVTNEAQSFALMGTGWQLGATMAPMLGALASKPAVTFPKIFGGTIFDVYPYALPCVIAAAIPFITVFFAVPLAQETHPGLRVGKTNVQYSKIQQVFDTEDDSEDKIVNVKDSMSSDTTLVDDSAASTTPCSLKSFNDSLNSESKWACGAGFVLLLRFMVLSGVMAVSTSELLLFFSSPSIGGLGLSQQQMSIFLSARPVLVTMFTLSVCPKLFGRYSSEALFKVFICFTPLYITVYLILAIIVAHGPTSSVTVTILLGLSLVLQTIGNPLYLALNVLLNSRAPSQSHLSSLNAWCELVQQSAMGVGAELGSAGFAWSIEHHVLGGKFIWVALIIYTTTTALVAQKLSHRDGWRERQTLSEDA